MNLNHLAVFHAVASEGSVSRGADRLLISQPAASKQVRLLEKALRSTLLDRHPKGVRLTAAGELLASYASRLFALDAEAESALAELRGLKRGRLTVGSSTTVGVYLLPGAFVRFRQTWPDLELRLELLPSAAIRSRLVDGTLDVGVTAGAIETGGLVAEAFAADALVPIAAPTHPLARKRAVSVEALCREPFVVRETGSGSRSLAERVLADMGRTTRPAMSLGSTEGIKHAVAAGVGVAVVSRLAIEVEVAAKRLVQLRVPDLQIVRPIRWLRAEGHVPSPAAVAFQAVLQK